MTDLLSGSRPTRLTLLLTLLGAAALTASMVDVWPTRFVWNASPSVPRGLYLVDRSPPYRGDLVLVRLPQWAAELADRRGYLPRQVPALKRIAALAGDRICRFGGALLVNGKLVASAHRVDQRGRRLPIWAGCRILHGDEVFLLANHPSSFDGRYFGVMKITHTVGRATPSFWR